MVANISMPFALASSALWIVLALYLIRYAGSTDSIRRDVEARGRFYRGFNLFRDDDREIAFDRKLAKVIAVSLVLLSVAVLVSALLSV